MKYFWIGSLLVVFAGCNSRSDSTIQSDAIVSFVDTDSTAQIPRVMTELLTGYLQMKSFFPDLSDSLSLKQHARQMIVWADSLDRLSVRVSPPLRDSLQILTMAISDELKGLMEETDKKGIGLSFQLTGLQLYDLLRLMRFSNGKVYFFQSMAGGEGEAGWLDITPVSAHPFLETGLKEKAIDSIFKR